MLVETALVFEASTMASTSSSCISSPISTSSRSSFSADPVSVSNWNNSSNSLSSSSAVPDSDSNWISSSSSIRGSTCSRISSSTISYSTLEPISSPISAFSTRSTTPASTTSTSFFSFLPSISDNSRIWRDLFMSSSALSSMHSRKVSASSASAFDSSSFALYATEYSDDCSVSSEGAYCILYRCIISLARAAYSSSSRSS
mmetsp:Transcript_9717/g.16072  ORF Transcript_9717/g.16072 Transcript_9717/m.16072 type:complete len:201 (-) Transcript_9717:259-861(-)